MYKILALEKILAATAAATQNPLLKMSFELDAQRDIKTPAFVLQAGTAAHGSERINGLLNSYRGRDSAILQRITDGPGMFMLPGYTTIRKDIAAIVLLERQAADAEIARLQAERARQQAWEQVKLNFQNEYDQQTDGQGSNAILQALHQGTPTLN